MTISEHELFFAEYVIEDWEPGAQIEDPENTLIRISVSYDSSADGNDWTDKFALFLDCPEAAEVPGIVVGQWEEMGEEGGAEQIVQALVAARDQLKSLHVIFFADVTYEESEISWIAQTDMAPLFASYPNLTHFCVRGGMGLSLGVINHENLKQLVVQTGGLSAHVVNQIAMSRMPRLEHLELWLGDSNYGADCQASDLEPLFFAELFPRLTYLGLKNSEITDDIAEVLSSTEMELQLDELDLSMGTLSDRGAEALLECDWLGKLRMLDISHHYMSTEVMNRFTSLGIEVLRMEEQLTPDQYNGESYRYVAVGE